MWDDAYWAVAYWDVEYWGEGTSNLADQAADRGISIRYRRLGPANVRIFVERN